MNIRATLSYHKLCTLANNLLSYRLSYFLTCRQKAHVALGKHFKLTPGVSFGKVKVGAKHFYDEAGSPSLGNYIMF